jgi:hypothetical protein
VDQQQAVIQPQQDLSGASLTVGTGGSSVAADDAEVQRLLADGALPSSLFKRRPYRRSSVPAVHGEPLPPEMVGAAHFSVAQLAAIAKRCGDDLACWRETLRVREGEKELSGQVESTLTP